MTSSAPRARLFLLAAAVLAVAAGAVLRVRTVAARSETVPSADEDSRQYYSAALNFARSGVFSASSPDEAGPKEPTSIRGPMYPAYLALALGDGRSAPAPAWRANLAASGATVILTAAAGLALASPLTAAAAAGLIALDPKQFEALWTLDVQAFFTVLILCAALALILWARRPTLTTAAAAGFVVGITLCCRSTMILFPFFWAAVLWTLRAKLKRPLAQAAVFAAGAALAALPCALRQQRVSGHFQILETQTVHYVIATGSLGVVSNDYAMQTAAGEDPSRAGVYRGMSDDSPRGNASEFARAAARLASRPGRYLLACLLRFFNLWGAWLLVWPLLLYELARGRDRLDRWALAAIPLYWNIHAFILSSHRHSAPVTPLLALGAGLAAARLLKEPKRAPAPVAYLLLIPLLLWGWTVAAMAHESARLPVSQGAVALKLESADALEKEGRPADALAALASIDALAPGSAQREELARRYQRFGENATCADLFEALSAEYPDHARFRNDAAVCDALAGRAARAREQAEAALRLDSKLLPAYLTLASLRIAAKDPKGALKIYETALALPPEGLDPALRRVISDERLRLRGLKSR